MPKTRKEKRDERSQAVCQEVRHQMVRYGGIADNKTLYDLMAKWMRVTGKVKYKHTSDIKRKSPN